MKTRLLITTLALGISTLVLPAQERAGGPEGGRPPGREGGPGGPGGPGGLGGQRPVNPIIAALDLNGDGVLDADEIAKASDSLKKLDKNGDGKITPDEYRPQRPVGAQGGPGGQGPGRRPGGPEGEGRPQRPVPPPAPPK